MDKVTCQECKSSPVDCREQSTRDWIHGLMIGLIEHHAQYPADGRSLSSYLYQQLLSQLQSQYSINIKINPESEGEHVVLLQYACMHLC